MARPKQSKQKPASETRTIGVRASAAYAEWAQRVAQANRSTVAGLVDQALVAYARQIGFTEPPPDR